jgi:hypothetical protein
MEHASAHGDMIFSHKSTEWFFPTGTVVGYVGRLISSWRQLRLFCDYRERYTVVDIDNERIFRSALRRLFKPLFKLIGPSKNKLLKTKSTVVRRLEPGSIETNHRMIHGAFLTDGVSVFYMNGVMIPQIHAGHKLVCEYKHWYVLQSYGTLYLLNSAQFTCTQLPDAQHVIVSHRGVVIPQHMLHVLKTVIDDKYRIEHHMGYLYFWGPDEDLVRKVYQPDISYPFVYDDGIIIDNRGMCFDVNARNRTRLHVLKSLLNDDILSTVSVYLFL